MTYDDNTSVRADIDMRNDPERLGAIKTQIEHRQAVFAQAHELVTQATALLRTLGDLSDQPLTKRCADAVFLARIQMDHDARLVLVEPTETYLGNMAAFGSPIGWTPTTHGESTS